MDFEEEKSSLYSSEYSCSRCKLVDSVVMKSCFSLHHNQIHLCLFHFVVVGDNLGVKDYEWKEASAVHHVTSKAPFILWWNNIYIQKALLTVQFKSFCLCCQVVNFYGNCSRSWFRNLFIYLPDPLNPFRGNVLPEPVPATVWRKQGTPWTDRQSCHRVDLEMHFKCIIVYFVSFI